MKRVPPKAKKKAKPKKAEATGSLRGKYKHLDLMEELMKARQGERTAARKLRPIYQPV